MSEEGSTWGQGKKEALTCEPAAGPGRKNRTDMTEVEQGRSL